MTKALLVCGAFMFAAAIAFAAENATQPAAKVSLQVKAPEKITVKEPGTWGVSLKNEGQEAITIVKPGDGSDCGWRTPIISWFVMPELEETKPPREPVLKKFARCGNINQLNASEIVTLKPGESVTFDGWAGRPEFPKAGKYHVFFYYTNDPTHKWNGLPRGKHPDAAMKAVQASTPVAVRSEALTVEVLP